MITLGKEKPTYSEIKATENTRDDHKYGQPHNDFYRQALNHVQVAKEFFAANLPKYVLDLVDLNTLKPEKDTFSDPQIGVGAADALFSVKFCNEDGYLVILSEHQSKPDHFMTLRLKKYMIMFWENYRSEHPKAKHIPLIYALIYYTGRTPYTVHWIFLIYSNDLIWPNPFLLIQIH